MNDPCVLNTALINKVVSSIFKQVKKPGSDSSRPNNFRPFSELIFLLKSMEKIVYCQLRLFLDEHSIFEVLQSDF